MRILYLHLFWNMAISKRLDQRSIVGQQGVNLIERVVLSIGWVWHRAGTLETGIDGIIEIRDSLTGETTNSIIEVQSKATANPFQAESDDGFEYLTNAVFGTIRALAVRWGIQPWFAPSRALAEEITACRLHKAYQLISLEQRRLPRQFVRENIWHCRFGIRGVT